MNVMVKYGLLQSGNVQGALDCIRNLLDPTSVAVVRSVDSAHTNHEIARILAHHDIPNDIVYGNVTLSLNDIYRGSERGIFTGFDEVWIYGSSVPKESLQDLPAATSDAVEFTQEIPSKLVQAFESTDCVLLIGDGCGLNFATKSDEIAESFKAYWLESFGSR